MKHLLKNTVIVLAIMAGPALAAEVPSGMTPMVCVEQGAESNACSDAMAALDRGATMVDVDGNEISTITLSTSGDVAGCNLSFPFSLVDETSAGENCPATAGENAAGQIIFATVLMVGGAEAMGADLFPLGSRAAAAPMLIVP